MKYAIQVGITTDEGQPEIREIGCLEREDLPPTTLGLTLAEAKARLKALQAVVVGQQMTAYLNTQRPCAHCGHPPRSQGSHTTQVRTVFGIIAVKCPRLHQCSCQPPLPRRSVPDCLAPRASHAGVAVSGNEVGCVGVVWRHRLWDDALSKARFEVVTAPKAGIRVLRSHEQYQYWRWAKEGLKGVISMDDRPAEGGGSEKQLAIGDKETMEARRPVD